MESSRIDGEIKATCERKKQNDAEFPYKSILLKAGDYMPQIGKGGKFILENLLFGRTF